MFTLDTDQFPFLASTDVSGFLTSMEAQRTAYAGLPEPARSIAEAAIDDAIAAHFEYLQSVHDGEIAEHTLGGDGSVRHTDDGPDTIESDPDDGLATPYDLTGTTWDPAWWGDAIA